MAAHIAENDITMKLADNIDSHKILSVSPVQLLSMLTFAVQNKHHEFVSGITPSEDTIILDSFDYKQDFLTKISETLREKGYSQEDKIQNFAVLKYYLDKLFLEITEKGTLEYSYQKIYMVSSSHITAKLNISRSTLHRYKELGMENVQKQEFGHKTYPIHNVFYWSNTLWISQIQALYQSYKIRNQTNDDLIKEIKNEIRKFEIQYGGSFNVIFNDIISGKVDIYELDEPDDFKDWKSLLEDLQELESNRD
ncbi:hypothetical protein [Cytobacillus horneckiae]|uniref:hypothetical protein n=1 Tax=Cytobacillus horneckiae TaxID=549687 RepID=UPI003D9AA4C5